MNDGDQTVTVPQGASGDVPERARAYDDVTVAEESLAAGLPSLSLPVISAALRRRAWLWRATAVAGLLIGFGLSLALPPAYQASATILLTPAPGTQVGEEMPNDVALLQSHTVADLAMHKLGLQQGVGGLLGTYTATGVTDRVLVLVVSAPSSNEAVSRANALAMEFLQFRANQVQAQQQLVFTALNQQIANLQAQRGQAASALTGLEQATNKYLVTTQQATASMVQGSEILDAAAPLPHVGRLKLAILYGAAGLGVGLALGLGIVIVGAIVSDRLRWRDDVAHALGAPVNLSVGGIPADRGLAAAGGPDMQRIVAHLRDAVPESSRGAAALAVVAVDNAQVAALSVVSLALSCAQEGKQVVVADLSSGAPAAHLLGAKDAGVRAVSVHDARLVVAVPDRDDVVPVGPLHHTSPPARPAPAGEALADAYASADLLLTLVTLDPSLGGEHLATWAADVVVVVTAGRSSSTRVRAVGEMIRLAGTHLVSTVLVGADSTDESLGATQTPSPPDNVVYWQGSRV